MLNISGIHEGFVLDHIKAGMSLQIYRDLKLDKLDCTVAIIKNAKSSKMGKKDIIKVECPIESLDLDILGFIDHNITVNVIKGDKIVDKMELKLPHQVKNVIKCKTQDASLQLSRSLTRFSCFPMRKTKSTAASTARRNTKELNSISYVCQRDCGYIPRKLDKTFQYSIPDELLCDIRPGVCVDIPFGSRIITGYVIEVTDKPEYDPARTKPLIGIKADSVAVEAKLIALAAWIRRNYGSTMNQALKTVIPVKKQAKEQVSRSIALKIDKVKARAQLALCEAKNKRQRLGFSCAD